MRLTTIVVTERLHLGSSDLTLGLINRWVSTVAGDTNTASSIGVEGRTHLTLKLTYAIKSFIYALNEI